MSFKKELEELLNKYSKERENNTPDFLLAEYLLESMNTFNRTMAARDRYHNQSSIEINAIKEQLQSNVSLVKNLIVKNVIDNRWDFSFIHNDGSNREITGKVYVTESGAMNHSFYIPNFHPQNMEEIHSIILESIWSQSKTVD